MLLPVDVTSDFKERVNLKKGLKHRNSKKRDRRGSPLQEKEMNKELRVRVDWSEELLPVITACAPLFAS